MSTRYYITTPIYYVNDRPHIGHCFTTVMADVQARYRRLRGDDVFFLTGTDEHADKVVTAAKMRGLSPEEWTDRNAAAFREAFAFLNCSNDDFIRTTEARHRERVERYIAALITTGDVYKGEYEGWYDEGQEEHITENAAREAGYKSTISQRPLVKRSEPCYFFRLSKYEARLLSLIESNEWGIEPEARRSETLGRIRAGLGDVAMSRPVTDDPATQWGIRIPGDPGHRLYVWIDALFNYLSVVDTPERRGYWPADVHLIGKDILWFHAVIWPAVLLALRGSSSEWSWVELPRRVFGHGWWTADGRKMSKSDGNFIEMERLESCAKVFGLDALRWYLTSQGPMAGGDSDWVHARVVEVYNADLANGIGNSASRVSNMIGKYFPAGLPEPGPANHAGHDWRAIAGKRVEAYARAMEAMGYSEACAATTGLVAEVDAYINATQPFKLAKRAEAEPGVLGELATILTNCAEALRIATVLMHPVMPSKTVELWSRWGWRLPEGAGLEAVCAFGSPHALTPGTPIVKGEALFMRHDPAGG